MADLRISQLPALPGVLLQAIDQLAVVDISASETKSIDSKDLVQAAIQLIDAGSIPGDKVTIVLPAGIVVTATLADGAVTAAKLANSSTAVIGASLPTSGAYTGQLGITTAANAASVWDGGKWVALEKGYTTLTGGSVNDVSTVITAVGNSAQILAQIDNSTIPASFLAGPTASGGAVTLRTIIPADLPLATSANAGIVAVPTGQGLRVNSGGSGSGANLEIDNDVVSSGDAYIVTYNPKGLILSGRPIASADIPIAASGAPGAVSVGSEFTIDPGGDIKHRNQVAPGTFTKVTYDSQGHITSGVNLAQADIPALSAAILTTGTLDIARIGNADITREKLADYSISYIQEAKPSVTAIHHVGCLWYQESSAQLRMFNGNSWMPVGFGRLSEENLRFCGTADATTGTVLDTTQFGQAAGMVSANPIPAATDALAGAYLVVKTPGTYAGDTYDAGDWILCLGKTNGWVRVDTLTGSGGGALIKLEDLLDVNITSPVVGDTLIFDPITSKWLNRSTSARKATFLEPFDGIRTSFTMNVSAGTVNDILMSIGGVLQEPGKDFSFTAARSINFSSAPSTNLDYWIVIEGVPTTGGGGGGTTLPPGTAADEILTWDNNLSSWVPSATLDGGSF